MIGATSGLPLMGPVRLPQGDLTPMTAGSGQRFLEHSPPPGENRLVGNHRAEPSDVPFLLVLALVIAFEAACIVWFLAA